MATPCTNTGSWKDPICKCVEVAPTISWRQRFHGRGEGWGWGAMRPAFSLVVVVVLALSGSTDLSRVVPTGTLADALPACPASPQAPSSFRTLARLRGGSEFYSGDVEEWEMLDSDHGDDAGGFEEEADDSALNAATFGGVVNDDGDRGWDDIAMESLALKSGHFPVEQPTNAPDTSRSIQYQVAASHEPRDRSRPLHGARGGKTGETFKRQWLPEGDDTPIEYIAESIHQLAEKQRVMIEADLANGGPGTAPDLSVLFEREYPEACAPDWDNTGSRDFDVPANWSPYPLEALFGGDLTVDNWRAEQEGRQPEWLRVAEESKERMPDESAYRPNIWHVADTNGRGLQGIWDYDAAPVPEPKGWWDDLGLYHPWPSSEPHPSQSSSIPGSVQVRHDEDRGKHATQRVSDLSSWDKPAADISTPRSVHRGESEPTSDVAGSGNGVHRAPEMQWEEEGQDRSYSERLLHLPHTPSHSAVFGQAVVAQGEPWEKNKRHEKVAKALKAAEKAGTEREPANNPGVEGSDKKKDKTGKTAARDKARTPPPPSAEPGPTKARVTDKRKAAEDQDSSPFKAAGKSKKSNDQVRGDKSQKREAVEESAAGVEKALTGKQLLDAVRDAAQARNHTLMCQGLWNMTQLPAKEANSTLKILSERSVGKKVRRALSSLVAVREREMGPKGRADGIQDRIGSMVAVNSSVRPERPWADKNDVIEVRSQKSREAVGGNGSLGMTTGVTELQDEHAGVLEVNITGAKLWMPAGVHLHQGVAADLASGSGLATVEKVRIAVMLARALYATSNNLGSVDLAEANQTFADFALWACDHTDAETEAMVHVYLAKARMRARLDPRRGVGREMVHIAVANLALLAAGDRWQTRNTSRVLVMAADTLCYRLSQPEDIEEAGRLLTEAHALHEGQNADVATAYAQYLMRFCMQSATAVLERGLNSSPAHRGLISAFAEAARRATGHVNAQQLRAVLMRAVDVAQDAEDRVFAMCLAAKMLPLKDRERESLYRQALALLPDGLSDDVEPLKGYGLVLARRGCADSAIQVLTKAYELAPNDVHAAACLAATLVRSRRTPEFGVKLLAAVLVAGFQTVDTLSSYAFCLELGYRITNESHDRTHALDRAADIYRKVLELVPDDSFSLQQYALLLWQEEDRRDDAEALLRAALERNPMCAFSRLTLAAIVNSRNDSRAVAQAEFEKTLEYSADMYAAIPPAVFQRYCHFLLKVDGSRKKEAGNRDTSADKMPAPEELERAEELYAHALKQHPGHAGLLLDKARFHYLIKQETEPARALLKHAYALHPQESAVALAYAQFSDAVDGSGPSAAKLYARAYALNPLEPNAASGLALHLHHFSSDSRRAALTYEAAIQLAPHDLNLLTNFAVFKEEMQRDVFGARAILERALELHPADVECRTYYATMLQESCHDATLAQQQFAIAVEQQPSNVKLLCKYGNFLEEEASADAHASAEILYLRALQLQPEAPNALCSLGNLRYTFQQDVQGAIDLYERALSIDPAHIATLCNYGILYHENLRAERRARMISMASDFGAEGLGPSYLLQEMKTHVCQNPKPTRTLPAALTCTCCEALPKMPCCGKAPSLSSTVGALLESSPLFEVASLHTPPCKQRLARAADLYERALKVHPHHVPAICNYAALMSQVAGDLDKAALLYQRAMALEPQDATVLCNLGNLKREQSDDLVGAELLYKRALAADPNHLQTLLSYGHQVALHSDDYDKAERLLEQALALRPTNSESQQGLQWIRNMRSTFGGAKGKYAPEAALGSAAKGARLEWERRKSLKEAHQAATPAIDPQAEAEAENMAKLLLEEEEQTEKQSKGKGAAGASKKPVKKRKAKRRGSD